jgi:hypothetical protein
MMVRSICLLQKKKSCEHTHELINMNHSITYLHILRFLYYIIDKSKLYRNTLNGSFHSTLVIMERAWEFSTGGLYRPTWFVKPSSAPPKGITLHKETKTWSALRYIVACSKWPIQLYLVIFTKHFITNKNNFDFFYKKNLLLTFKQN